MNAVCVDISQLLHDNSLGVLATDLFSMEWNEQTDAQILVLDQQGRDSDLKELYENPVFQILVRGEKGADMNTSYILMRAVHEFLIDQPSQAINGTDYLEYEPLGTIAGLGRDENDRAIFTSNYYTFRNPN